MSVADKSVVLSEVKVVIEVLSSVVCVTSV